MQTLFHRLFVDNWPRKLLSLVTAVIIWFIVNNSITITKTIPNVPVRVINLPQDKTIEGLLPSGILNQRVNVTLIGYKSTIQMLDSSDLEVVIDARDKGTQWVVKINKKSLIALNPDVDLAHQITEVSANEFIITLSRLITEKIPITITKPQGEPPSGYQFLDVWPQLLYQTVSGPEKQVLELKSTGLELTFDLDQISANQLNSLKNASLHSQSDEVSFPIPRSWKQIAIPFQDHILQEINDPEAELLRIDFLKRELLPLDIHLPVSVFYPVKYSSILNPEKYSLIPNHLIEKSNGLYLLKTALFAHDVSRLFLDVVRDNIELTIIASPSGEAEPLSWSIQFINQQELENTYLELAIIDLSDQRIKNLNPDLQESYLRSRFLTYMRQMTLFTSGLKPLEFDVEIKDHRIIVKDIITPESS